MKHVPEVLRERNYALFFTGSSLSVLGDAIVPVALAFAVLDLGLGASALGLVLAAGIVPGVALVLLGGVVADRFERRRLMLVCDVVRFISQAAQAFTLFTGQATVLSLILFQLAWGTAAAFFRPASTGLVAEWVKPAHLQEANGLVGLSENIAYTLGPVLSGILVGVFSPGAALLVDAITFGASAVALSMTKPVRAPVTAPADSMLQGLVEGWKEFRSRTWLWSMVLWEASFHLLALPAVLVLGPAVAESQLGGAPAWAAIAACAGLGAVIGGVIALKYKPRYILRASFIPLGLYGLQLVALAVPTSTVVIALAVLVGGVGVAMFNVYFNTALQQQIPLAVMSRVASYEWLGSLALLPIGQALIGPIASVTSISGVLIVAGAWMLLSPIVLLMIRSARDLPSTRVTPDKAEQAVL